VGPFISESHVELAVAELDGIARKRFACGAA
jgi:hypothetical protein